MAEDVVGAQTVAVIAPNASLTTAQALAWFGGIALVALFIAGLFASLGYWVILPFAGLELLALGAAFYVALRDNSYREVVRLERDEVVIEIGRGRPQRQWRCLRAWARIECEPSGTQGARLWIRGAGQALELGVCLTGEEKERLAVHLRSALAGTRPSTEQTG